MINGRDKGATFERRVAKLLTEAYNVSFSRTPQSGAFATTNKDTRLAGDIYCTEKEFIFVVECKKYAEYNLEDLITGNTGGIFSWLNQLEIEKKDKKGLLVFQRNYGKIFCLVEDFKFNPSFKFKNYYIGLFSDFLNSSKSGNNELFNH